MNSYIINHTNGGVSPEKEQANGRDIKDIV